MKILYIIDSLVEAGAEKSTVEIAKKITHFTPVFVSIYSNNTLMGDLEKAGIKVYSLNIQEKYGFAEVIKKLQYIYEVEKPEIIHSVLYRADHVARKMKKKYPEIPLVGSFVNNSYTPLRYKDQGLLMKLKLWMAYRLDKSSSKKVDFFISNSETIKKSEGGALGVPPEKIKVIYRGRDIKKFNIDVEEVAKLKKALNIENKNILVNVSRLIQRKGQLDIIKALPEVIKTHPNTVLLIVGDGEFGEILQQEIKSLKLEEKVKMLGRRRDIAQILAIADAFIYPSYAEGLPGALIEAMMSEKIIVASDIAENMECVNNDSALLYEKGNINKLSEKIIFAIKNKRTLKGFGEEAKKQAVQKFEISAIASKYEDVYLKLISGKLNA